MSIVHIRNGQDLILLEKVGWRHSQTRKMGRGGRVGKYHLSSPRHSCLTAPQIRSLLQPSRQPAWQRCEGQGAKVLTGTDRVAPTILVQRPSDPRPDCFRGKLQRVYIRVHLQRRVLGVCVCVCVPLYSCGCEVCVCVHLQLCMCVSIYNCGCEVCVHLQLCV